MKKWIREFLDSPKADFWVPFIGYTLSFALIYTGTVILPSLH